MKHSQKITLYVLIAILCMGVAIYAFLNGSTKLSSGIFVFSCIFFGFAGHEIEFGKEK